jgi:hypothetical protein
MKHVFDAQTKARAGNKPRLLISDGFAAHESLEVLKFCFENNIILCRLPSHTSHKLQPCDVGVFSALKTAYREQVELLYRRGSNTVGKEHFTILYQRARDSAMVSRNILSGWSKTGLFPFNPDRVLRDIRPVAPVPLQVEAAAAQRSRSQGSLQTPTTTEGLRILCGKINKGIRGQDDHHKILLQHLAHAAERAFADRSLLSNENGQLLLQNNEKRSRKKQARKVGNAKIMSYEDIIDAQRRQDEKKAARPRKRKTSSAPARQSKRACSDELQRAESEIERWRMETYCSVIAL